MTRQSMWTIEHVDYLGSLDHNNLSQRELSTQISQSDQKPDD